MTARPEDAAKRKHQQARHRRELMNLDLPGIEKPAKPEDDERYTTDWMMDWCLRNADVTGWDLDVAGCEEAHWAEAFITKEQNALQATWAAPRVWCNPPWSLLEAFIEHAWWEWVRKSSVIKTMSFVGPGNRTDQPYWQKYVEPWRDRHHETAFPGPESLSVLTPLSYEIAVRGVGVGIARFESFFAPGRVQYGCPGNPKGIGIKGSPNFTSCQLVWRR